MGQSVDLQRLQMPQLASRTSEVVEPAPIVPADGNSAGADADEDDDEDDGDVQAVLDKLQSLEMEKQRYEDMLRDSQDEHETLLTKLNDMRALMRSLNMNADD